MNIFVSGEQYGMISYYKSANDDIEKWTDIIHGFAMKILIPLYCIPLIIVSYFKYYAMSSAEESFFMIFPIAYVKTTISHITIFN